MLARLTPSIALRIGAALVVASLIIPAVPDVDLWGHTLFGGDIIRSGVVPLADDYSFTSDRPWINHEWLSEVSMHAAYMVQGGAGLVGLRLVLLSLLLWIVWRELRREGVPGETALLVLTIVALLTYPRTQHMRPQLFSLVAFAALLSELNAYDRDRSTLHLCSIPLLMAVWANLHGGFIVGFLPLALWAAAFAIGARDKPRNWQLATCLVCAAVLATLANPYGVGLWRFLYSTVGLQRSDITEWWSMASAGAGVLTMWIITLGIAAAGMRWQRPIRPHHTALVAILAVASFRVNRLDAFFVIATIMCFGGPLSVLWARRTHPERSRRLAPQMMMAVLVLCVCVASVTLLRAAPSRDGCVDNAPWLPEQDAAAFVASSNLQGRIIVFFNWGEYVLWHFSPNLKVSTDGRRETVYSDRHINGHLELYRGTDAGLAYARGLNADYVWLPKMSPALGTLQTEGWVPIFAGDRSTILARSPLPHRPAVDTSRASCFPGHSGKVSPLSSGLWRQM